MRSESALAASERLRLPPAWTRANLRDLCLKTGLLDPVKTPEREFDYVDVSSVSAEALKVVGTTRVRGAAAPSRARKLLRAADVLFATVRPTLRRVAIVSSELDGQLASTAFCVIRANPEVADSAFLYYAAISRDFVESVGALERGASYPAVTDSNVLDQEILLPPLDEQRAIADVLSKLQAAVETQGRIVAALKELKMATMAKLFREGLRGEPLKQTEIGEIPESWEIVQLGSVVNPVSGGTPSKGRPEWWQGSIPWASPKDMKRPRLHDTEDHISAEALAKGSRLVPAKTVFVVTRGMILAKDLPVAIAEVPMAFNQDMRALLPTGAINPDFLLYALTARKDALTSSIGTTAHGTRRLGSTSLEALALPKPVGEEQRQIAEVLSHLEVREELARRKAGLLRSLFAAMLGSLMTGQLRVPAGAAVRS